MWALAINFVLWVILVIKMLTNFGTCLCSANKCMLFYLQWITLCAACANNYAFGHTRVWPKNICLSTYRSDIFMKRCILLAHQHYAFLWSWGFRVHTRAHWLEGVFLRLPQCWLDEWVMIILLTAVCCWYLQCSKYFTDSTQCTQGMCSVEL